MPAEDGEGGSAGPEIEGYVDYVDGAHVVGWAFDPRDPGRRLVIEVRSADAVALALADRDRPDLRAAGKGDGRYGFEARIDPDAGADAAITVRDAASGRHLVGSPVATDVAARLAGPAGRGLLAAVGAEARVLLQRLRPPAP